MVVFNAAVFPHKRLALETGIWIYSARANAVIGASTVKTLMSPNEILARSEE